MDISWSVGNILVSFLLVAIILLCIGCYLCWRFDKDTYVSNYNYGSNGFNLNNNNNNNDGGGRNITSFRRQDEFNDLRLGQQMSELDLHRAIQELRLSRSTGSRRSRSPGSSISSHSRRSSSNASPHHPHQQQQQYQHQHRRLGPTGSVHVSPFHVPVGHDEMMESGYFFDDEDGGFSSYTTSRRTSDVVLLHLDDLPNYDAVSSKADQQSVNQAESPPSYAECVPSVPQLLLSPATPEPLESP